MEKIFIHSLRLAFAALLLVGSLTACQTDETAFYGDEESVTMNFTLGYHPLDTDFKIYIDGVEFKSGQIYMPLSSMQPDSTQEARITIQPIDTHGYNTGTPSEFTLDLKPDTAFTVIYAVNDQPRIMSADNADNFFNVSPYCMFFPAKYKDSQNSTLGITFNDEKLNMINGMPVTFYKGRQNTGTLKFYHNPIRKIEGHYGGGSDLAAYYPETEEPLGVIDNYTFTEDQNNTALYYFMPLGGDVQWFTDDNVAQCLKIRPDLRFITSASMDYQNGYRLYYNGELLMDFSQNGGDIYAVKGKGYETGEAMIEYYHVNFDNEMGTVDTVDVKEVYRGELAYDKFNFIFDGTVAPNIYQGADPADRQSAFVRLGAANLYDENYNEYTGNVDLELWTMFRNDDWIYEPVQMLAQVKNIALDTYSDPVEINVKDVFPADELAKLETQGQLEMYDPNTWEETEDGRKMSVSLQVRAFKPGTREELEVNINSALDMGSFPGLMTYTDDYLSLLPPIQFADKCYYLFNMRGDTRIRLNQGPW